MRSVPFKEGTTAVQSGDTFALGTHTITETATDAAGNTSTSSFTIAVQDTTAPVIAGQANETLEATGATGAVATFSASASDVVDGTDTVSFKEGTTAVQSGDTFALGTHTITEHGDRRGWQHQHVELHHCGAGHHGPGDCRPGQRDA